MATPGGLNARTREMGKGGKGHIEEHRGHRMAAHYYVFFGGMSIEHSNGLKTVDGGYRTWGEFSRSALVHFKLSKPRRVPLKPCWVAMERLLVADLAPGNGSSQN